MYVKIYLVFYIYQSLVSIKTQFEFGSPVLHCNLLGHFFKNIKLRRCYTELDVRYTNSTNVSTITHAHHTDSVKAQLNLFGRGNVLNVKEVLNLPRPQTIDVDCESNKTSYLHQFKCPHIEIVSEEDVAGTDH